MLRMRVQGVRPGVYKLGAVVARVKDIQEMVMVPQLPKRCARRRRAKPGSSARRGGCYEFEEYPCSVCHSRAVVCMGGVGVCSVCGYTRIEPFRGRVA